MTPESTPCRPEQSDTFNVEIALTHPAINPGRITDVLLMQPIFSWKAGDRIANVVKQSTRWYGRISSGRTPAEFARALEQVVSMLTRDKEFFAEFRRGGGEAELVLNYVVEHMDGKVLEVHLEPTLVGQVASVGIGLRLQAWSRNLS